jgi:hypothetical protein
MGLCRSVSLWAPVAKRGRIVKCERFGKIGANDLRKEHRAVGSLGCNFNRMDANSHVPLYTRRVAGRLRLTYAGKV